MATFSVDSDAVLTATGAIRATADRLQGETAAMLGQLTQRELEAALGDIGTALSHAGSQYAQTEAAASGLFR